MKAKVLNNSNVACKNIKIIEDLVYTANSTLLVYTANSMSFKKRKL